jgi:hypothetical protein
MIVKLPQKKAFADKELCDDLCTCTIKKYRWEIIFG